MQWNSGDRNGLIESLLIRVETSFRSSVPLRKRSPWITLLRRRPGTLKWLALRSRSLKLHRTGIRRISRMRMSLRWSHLPSRHRLRRSSLLTETSWKRGLLSLSATALKPPTCQVARSNTRAQSLPQLTVVAFIWLRLYMRKSRKAKKVLPCPWRT